MLTVIFVLVTPVLIAFILYYGATYLCWSVKCLDAAIWILIIEDLWLWLAIAP